MAETNETVAVPSAAHDVSDAILADPSATDAWRGLEPERKREYIEWIEETSDIELRGSRITQMILELTAERQGRVPPGYETGGPR